jgi:hypothetical protein
MLRADKSKFTSGPIRAINYLISNVTALKGARGMTQRDEEKIRLDNIRALRASFFLVALVPFFVWINKKVKMPHKIWGL